MLLARNGGRETGFALDICVICNFWMESPDGLQHRRVARLSRSRVAKPQAACLLTFFGSIDVDFTVPLAWFLLPGQFQSGFLSLCDPAPSEPSYPFRQSMGEIAKCVS